MTVICVIGHLVALLYETDMIISNIVQYNYTVYIDDCDVCCNHVNSIAVH